MRRIFYLIFLAKRYTDPNRKHTKTAKIWADEEIGHAYFFQVTASDDNVRLWWLNLGTVDQEDLCACGCRWGRKAPNLRAAVWRSWFIPVSSIGAVIAGLISTYVSHQTPRTPRYGWESNIVSLSKAEIFPVGWWACKKIREDLKWKGNFQLFCRSEKGMIRSMNNRMC